jgi:glycosyltransferase involved in cell wall biosynthesis
MLTAPLGPFEFPAVDAGLYWALAIVPGCLRLIRREKIDLIYSSSFPYSDHVTGYLLKKLSGKPWVVDFRDPWTQNASARNTGWRYRVDRWVEGRVLRAADRVIGVTPSYTADLRRLAAGRAAEDFVTIENGYDRADFPCAQSSAGEVAEADFPNAKDNAGEVAEADFPDAKDDAGKVAEAGFVEIASQKPLAMTGGRVTLAHVGFVYDGTALPFLRAVEALGEAGARLRVRFVGGLGATEKSWLAGRKLAAEVTVEPRRPHGEALEAMRAADFLLLFVIPGSPESGHYPGKLFEYMTSGRPILLVGSPGDAARLIQQSGTGCGFLASDEQRLVEALRRLIDDPEHFRDEIYHPQMEVIGGYERRALAGKLARVFGGLIGRSA